MPAARRPSTHLDFVVVSRRDSVPPPSSALRAIPWMRRSRRPRIGSPVLRRLLIALLLACPAIVLSQMSAHAACSCKPGNVQQSAQSADAVFSGVLAGQSTGPTGTDGARETTYEIEAETAYKGDIRTADVVVTSPKNACTLGKLVADRKYVFFVTMDGAAFTTDRCGGTGPANATLVDKVERVLGTGSDVGVAPPAAAEAAEFTKVDDAEPDSLTRLAAPGAALVIVGLLGLILVRLRSRSARS